MRFRAKVMGSGNAFGNLHEKHVKKKNVACILWDDVHGGADNSCFLLFKCGYLADSGGVESESGSGCLGNLGWLENRAGGAVFRTGLVVSFEVAREK
jgi:hypothetical protein